MPENKFPCVGNKIPQQPEFLWIKKYLVVYFNFFKFLWNLLKPHTGYILGNFLTLIFPRQRIKEGYFKLIFVWRSLKKIEKSVN